MKLLVHSDKTHPMKTSQKRLTLFLLATALWALAATGCNTVRGFGRDVEHAGEHIEDAAR